MRSANRYKISGCRLAVIKIHRKGRKERKERKDLLRTLLYQNRCKLIADSQGVATINRVAIGSRQHNGRGSMPRAAFIGEPLTEEFIWIKIETWQMKTY